MLWASGPWWSIVSGDSGKHKIYQTRLGWSTWCFWKERNWCSPLNSPYRPLQCCYVWSRGNVSLTAPRAGKGSSSRQAGRGNREQWGSRHSRVSAAVHPACTAQLSPPAQLPCSHHATLPPQQWQKGSNQPPKYCLREPQKNCQNTCSWYFKAPGLQLYPHCSSTCFLWMQHWLPKHSKMLGNI